MPALYQCGWKGQVCVALLAAHLHSAGADRFYISPFFKARPLRLLPEARLDCRKHTRLVPVPEPSGESCVVEGAVGM